MNIKWSRPVETRVNRLQKHFETLAKSPNHNFTLETVTNDIINQLRNLDYYPLDMLMVLEKLGCMRKWGMRGPFSMEMCAMIEWWTPCSIEAAKADNRCVYNLSDPDLLNPSGLLFFAWDCDAKCYFYDITVRPWKVLVCDGFSGGEALQVKPWEEDGANDFLTIIERWVADSI